MKYNIDFAISADLSAEVVEEMVKKIVEEQTGRTVSKVTFKTRSESDPMDRYSREVFNGARVDFKSEPS